jgi:hypothetical protein
MATTVTTSGGHPYTTSGAYLMQCSTLQSMLAYEQNREHHLRLLDRLQGVLMTVSGCTIPLSEILTRMGLAPSRVDTCKCYMSGCCGNAAWQAKASTVAMYKSTYMNTYNSGCSVLWQPVVRTKRVMNDNNRHKINTSRFSTGTKRIPSASLQQQR